MNDASITDQSTQRREKLIRLRQEGCAYPNGFKRTHLSKSLHEQYDALSKESLTEKRIHTAVAGRMMLRRMMGKASFAHLQDMSGQIQLYLTRDGLTLERYQYFKASDLGDIIGAEGYLFKTRTGELSIEVTRFLL